MNWIKRLLTKKETTKQCDVHVVVSNACICVDNWLSDIEKIIQKLENRINS